jgi:hypothetical protein
MSAAKTLSKRMFELAVKEATRVGSQPKVSIRKSLEQSSSARRMIPSETIKHNLCYYETKRNNTTQWLLRYCVFTTTHKYLIHHELVTLFISEHTGVILFHYILILDKMRWEICIWRFIHWIQINTSHYQVKLVSEILRSHFSGKDNSLNQMSVSLLDWKKLQINI